MLSIRSFHFPPFPLKLIFEVVQFVSYFSPVHNRMKHLYNQVIDNKLVDDKDIHRELKFLFMRTNMLSRRFNRCRVQVKIRLFQSFCTCFYDVGLWYNFSTGAYSKLAFAYNRCMKLFFGFDKYYKCHNCHNYVATTWLA